MSDKRRRHDQILDLLSRNRIDSQEQLQDLLVAEGLDTTQSTLSRDLRELGVVKGSRGYELPARDAAPPEALRTLAGRLEGRLESVDCGGNLVVLKTRGTDEARDVASAVESHRLHQVVAAMVCGDAVLLVSRSQSYAREVVQALRERALPRRSAR